MVVEKEAHAGHAANQDIKRRTVGTVMKEEKDLRKEKEKTMGKEEKP